MGGAARARPIRVRAGFPRRDQQRDAPTRAPSPRARRSSSARGRPPRRLRRLAATFHAREGGRRARVRIATSRSDADRALRRQGNGFLLGARRVRASPSGHRVVRRRHGRRARARQAPAQPDAGQAHPDVERAGACALDLSRRGRRRERQRARRLAPHVGASHARRRGARHLRLPRRGRRTHARADLRLGPPRRVTTGKLHPHGPDIPRVQSDDAWRALVERDYHQVGKVPFAEQWEAWRRLHADRPASAPPPPAYVPTKHALDHANAASLMRRARVSTFAELAAWSAKHRDLYWRAALDELRIPFHTPATALREGSDEDPRWLPGARLNIVDACFRADPARTAILFAREGEEAIRRVSYGDLDALSARVAEGFRHAGLVPGDAVALYLPMTVECVAAYLGIVRAGGVVVSIADSFAPPEVATRLRLGKAKAVLTLGAFTRGGKTIDLYAKVREADAPRAILIGGAPQREGDVSWEDFLDAEGPRGSVSCAPDATTNVLFSSGTTGDPKAIPWTHLTPIKAAADGRYHQDVHADDVVAWPTSIGWMMGPWLVYATLVN